LGDLSLFSGLSLQRPRLRWLTPDKRSLPTFFSHHRCCCVRICSELLVPPLFGLPPPLTGAPPPALPPALSTPQIPTDDQEGFLSAREAPPKKFLCLGLSFPPGLTLVFFCFVHSFRSSPGGRITFYEIRHFVPLFPLFAVVQSRFCVSECQKSGVSWESFFLRLSRPCLCPAARAVHLGTGQPPPFLFFYRYENQKTLFLFFPKTF